MRRRQLLLLSIASAVASVSHAAVPPSDSFLDDAADLMQENDETVDTATSTIDDGIIPLEAPEEIQVLELDQDDATFDVLEEEDDDAEDEEEELLEEDEENADPATADEEEEQESYEMPDFRNKDVLDFDRPRLQPADDEDDMLVPEGVEEIVDQNNNNNDNNINNVNGNSAYWIHDTEVDPIDFYDDGVLAYGHQTSAQNRYYSHWRIFLLVAFIILVVKIARRRNGKALLFNFTRRSSSSHARLPMHHQEDVIPKKTTLEPISEHPETVITSDTSATTTTTTTSANNSNGRRASAGHIRKPSFGYGRHMRRTPPSKNFIDMIAARHKQDTADWEKWKEEVD